MGIHFIFVSSSGFPTHVNGIELSPDDIELFPSSAENNVDEITIAVKLLRFKIDAETGAPKSPQTGIDLYKTLEETT